ncbi:MAG: radical SAM protein [Lachnospiraceae bacterium]
MLDGVCITGGEPTLEPELPELIRSIKELGYLVKLDTNGTHPAIVRKLAEEKLIDYVAMDIKSSREHYARLAGNSSEKLLAVVEETAAFLMEGNLDYEFRTTVVRELHEQEDFVAIRDWLAGARRYYLQAYRDSEHILKSGNYSSYSREELERFAAILREKIPVVEVRGLSKISKGQAGRLSLRSLKGLTSDRRVLSEYRENQSFKADGTSSHGGRPEPYPGFP